MPVARFGSLPKISGSLPEISGSLPEAAAGVRGSPALPRRLQRFDLDAALHIKGDQSGSGSGVEEEELEEEDPDPEDPEEGF